MNPLVLILLGVAVLAVASKNASANSAPSRNQSSGGPTPMGRGVTVPIVLSDIGDPAYLTVQGTPPVRGSPAAYAMISYTGGDPGVQIAVMAPNPFSFGDEPAVNAGGNYSLRGTMRQFLEWQTRVAAGRTPIYSASTQTLTFVLL